MNTCIYCRSAGPFNREHVIHEGFGRFRNTLVLHNTVCADCNQGFGDTIDLALTRSSVEGFERYRFGVKEPSEIEKFRYGDLKLRAKVEGDFAGAAFEHRASPDGTHLVARLLPGLAVRRKDSDEFVHFTEQEALDGAWLKNPDVDWHLGFRVFGDEASTKRIEEALRAQGVIPSYRRLLTPPADGEMLVEQEFQITTDMQRALAKTAVNYLAYTQGSAYALRPEFDVVRRFVRYGKMPPSVLPRVLSLPGLPFSRINAGDTILQDGERRPVVHFVSIGVNQEYRDIAAGITLFGFMAHRVLLAEGFQGGLPAPRAHLYNVKTLDVFELGVSPTSDDPAS